MMSRKATQSRWIVPAVLTTAVVASILLLSVQSDAQGQNAAANAMQVGTYDQQALFQEYPGSDELTEFYRDLQQRMQQAQQEGNQQKLQELQQEAEAKRQQVLQGFQNAVKTAIPQVAEEADVQVVALQVVYAADDVEQADLTRPLAQAIAAE